MIKARLKVLYLLLITVAAFLVPEWEQTRPAQWYVVPGLLVLQVVILLACRIHPLELLRAATRLKWLFAILIACYVLLPAEGNAGDQDVRPWTVPGTGWVLQLNLTGLEQSGRMCLQILVLIMVSAVVRLTGSGTDLLDGLRGFGLPKLFVYSIDHTLSLIGGLRPRGMGGGSGGGRGRRRHAQVDPCEAAAPALGASAATGPQDPAGAPLAAPTGSAADNAARPVIAGAVCHPAATSDSTPAPGRTSPGFFAVLRRLARGDTGYFIDAIRGNLERARQQVLDQNGTSLDPRLAHDVVVVTGIAMGMMSLKMLKTLPGLPFASGHKTLLLFPLYILASYRTHSRWGGTTAGSIMGILGYLQGDGRYGVLEILKHLAPGLVIDLTRPIVRRLPQWILTYCVLGFVAAIARTATEWAAVLLLSARWEVFIFPMAKLVPNVISGTLSGFVTYGLLKAFENFKPDLEEPLGVGGEPTVESPPKNQPVAPEPVGAALVATESSDALVGTGASAPGSGGGGGRGQGRGTGGGRGGGRGRNRE